VNTQVKALLWFCIPILGLFLIFHPWTEPGGPGRFWVVILPLLMVGATFLNPVWWLFWWALERRSQR
jgi:hypothetical protein